MQICLFVYSGRTENRSGKNISNGQFAPDVSLLTGGFAETHGLPAATASLIIYVCNAREVPDATVTVPYPVGARYYLLP